MSLTATLLFGLPIRLPVGTVRRISHDDTDAYALARSDADYSHRYQCRDENIAKIVSALAEGLATYLEIAEATGLSESTVKKRMFVMEDEGKIVRDRSGRVHRFSLAGGAA